MTIEAYNKATKILEEKKQLEEELNRVREKAARDFVYSLSYSDDRNKEFIEITEKLFNLGAAFAAL